MIRLTVVVEGETELSFVKHALAPHLRRHAVYATPIRVTTSVDPLTGCKRAGGGDWTRWKRELRRIMLDKGQDARFTTLFDLYGLPGNFPGLAEHSSCADTEQRAERLEAAMLADLAADPQRFIPYLQRHEFEALVLAAIPQLEGLLDDRNDVRGCKELQKVVAAAGSPEDVNDGPQSAPSKRLRQAVPSYRKTVHGPLAVEALGLAQLRVRCPRFGSWVQRLEGLGVGAT